MTYTVHTETVATAQVGDYFRLPQQPIVKIIAAFDLGDYVSYQVQAGGEKPQYWEVMKPEAQLDAQERDRIQAEIIDNATPEQVADAIVSLSVLERYDWLTEPIGAGLDYIFGMTGEQQAEALPPVETGYHDSSWTSDDTEF